jgi:hypothetical protein
MPRNIEAARRVPYSENYRGFLFSELIEPEFLEALSRVEEPGTTLALTDTLPEFMNLAAWNPGYTNRVVWAEWEGDGEKWLNELYAKHADSVYVKPDSDALKWIMGHPSSFELVMYDPVYGGLVRVVHE